MPQRNEPKTLCQSSMVTIGRNFDYLCYNCRTSAEMRKMIDDESFLDVEGPFQNLPSPLLSELMTVLDGGCIQFRMQKKHLHLLLLPHLECLKLSPTSAANNMGFELALSRCKRLRNLDLSYLCHVSPTVIVRLIPTLTQVTILNLKMTEITDQILELIGKHCPEIRDLDVSLSPITSQGVLSLCYDPETQKALCRKLSRLSILGCLVSSDAVSFLLQKVPSVREIQFENTFQAFQTFETLPIDLSNLGTVSQTFDLSNLTSTEGNLSPTTAEIATTLCPFATSVTLTNSLSQNEVLYKFMVLSHLLHLRLTNNDALSLDFHEGVLPVLTAAGDSLVSLLLSKFIAIDINAIGECCPKLRNLAFSSIAHFEEVLYPKETLFNHLTALEIWTDVFAESMTSVLLKQLLMFCPHLHNLLISGTQALSDKLLTEIWKENPMNELSRLTIENCPNISISSFDALLDAPNKLVLLRVWSCFLVTRKDHDLLQARIKDENCDLYLDWYPWMG